MLKTNDHLLKKVEVAFQNVLISMPHLAGLIQLIDFRLDHRVPTAGVFASGKMLFNPDWLEELKINEVTFILAHELMHLILSTHERGIGANAKLVNIAHDLIINEQLEKVFGVPTPAGGLMYRGFLKEWNNNAIFTNFSDVSLEELVQFLKQKQAENKLQNTTCWPTNIINPSKNSSQDTLLGNALQGALNNQDENPIPSANNEIWDSDVFTENLEKKLFPNENDSALKEKSNALKNKVFEAISLETIQDRIINLSGSKSRGTEPGNQRFTYQALKDHYAPPWQWAMQQWLESTSSTHNSYSRPSRRGQYKNFVRPGKVRLGYTLHIVLDTSGSMEDVLPKHWA